MKKKIRLLVVMLVMSLLAGILWLGIGLYLAPVYALWGIAIVCVTMLVLTSFWYFICQRQGVPWWLWEDVTEDGVKYTKIIILGMIEIRNVPAKYAWVVRNSFERQPKEGVNSEDDPNPLRGFCEFRSGWRCIIFPKLVWITEALVNLKQLNLDVPPIVVNTSGGKDKDGRFKGGIPVHFDGFVTYKVTNPILFATRFQEDLATVVRDILSVAANTETQDFTDMDLYEHMSKKEIQRLSMTISNRVNQNVDGALGAYGVQVTYGIQNIYPSQDILDAHAGRREAEYDADAATFRALSIKQVREAAGVPQESPWNIFLAIADQAARLFSSPRAGTDFQFPQITVGGGGISSGKRSNNATRKNDGEE